MAYRYEAEVTIGSAKDLKNVNWRHGPLKPYAVVWIEPKAKCSTRIDEEGDTCPIWDEKLVIPLVDSIEDSTLFIDIVHANAADNTKPLIGSARLPLREVVDDVGLGERATRNLQLKRPSGRPQGKIEVKVSVRHPVYRAPEPYYAPPYGVPPAAARDYPAPPPPPYGNPYAAPPPDPYRAGPPVGYAYGAPAYGQASYGQGGYGQPLHGQQEKTKSKYGMGTGLAVGAAAGLLGGLAIAEGVDYVEDKIEDDVAERVEDDLGYGDDDF